MRFDQHTGDSEDESPVNLIRRTAIRAVLLALFWLLLANGEPASWVIGIPTVLVATGVSCWLSPRTTWGWQLRGFVRFAPSFVYWSLKGGIAVARQATDPRLPLLPELVDYPLQLPDGTARVFFVNVVSLLPGALSADIRGDTLVVHVLDNRLPVSMELERLETAVAALFGISLLSKNRKERSVT